MISAEHYSKTIFQLFFEFKTYCEERNKWPVFLGVVSDFSLANLHAIIKSCNGITLLEYIEKTYFLVIDQNFTNVPEGFITVYLCYAHFIKMASKMINDHFNDPFARSFFKKAFAQAVVLEGIKEIEIWFTNLSFLLTEPFENNHTINATKYFDNGDNLIHRPDFILIYDFDKIISTDKNKLLKDNKLLKNNSFYKHFKLLLPNLTCDPVDLKVLNVNVNKFQNKPVLDVILNKYIPFLSLWTNILKRAEKNKPFTNTYAENYFGNLKKNILEGERNLKASRFVRKSRENILAIHKEISLNIPKNKLTKIKLKKSGIKKRKKSIQSLEQDILLICN